MRECVRACVRACAYVRVRACVQCVCVCVCVCVCAARARAVCEEYNMMFMWLLFLRLYVHIFVITSGVLNEPLSVTEIPCCIIGIITGIFIFSFNPHTLYGICFYCLRVLHLCDLFCFSVFSLERLLPPPPPPSQSLSLSLFLSLSRTRESSHYPAPPPSLSLRSLKATEQNLQLKRRLTKLQNADFHYIVAAFSRPSPPPPTPLLHCYYTPRYFCRLH